MRNKLCVECIIIIIFSVLVLAAVYSVYGGVSNFKECSAAGHEIVRGYPSKCVTPDGREFTEELKYSGHNCSVSEGYEWDKEIVACVRRSELDEYTREAAKLAVRDLGYGESVTVLEVEDLGELGSFVVIILKKGEEHRIELENWEIVSESLTEEKCYSKGGSLVKIKEDVTSCGDNELSIGEVTGFIRKTLCCVRQDVCEGMPLNRAKEIASNSECTGNIVGHYVCNSYRNTWSIDMNLAKNGCDPICVVDIDTEEATINWRCSS